LSLLLLIETLAMQGPNQMASAALQALGGTFVGSVRIRRGVVLSALRHLRESV
jgi:hypothetical protein